jgi:hypothetical protein
MGAFEMEPFDAATVALAGVYKIDTLLAGADPTGTMYGLLDLAEQLDRCAPGLTLKERFTYAQAPVDTRTDTQVQEFLDWTSSHALIPAFSISPDTMK